MTAKPSGARPRLYQTPSSYYSMIARLALAEGGIAYERVFVDIHFRLSQQQPDYVRLNPGMTVPTLVLADRILVESRDIAEYALGSAPDPETKGWVDLHYGYPIEELTFGGILARNPLARIMIPKRLEAARRQLLAQAMSVLNDREKDILMQRRLADEPVTLEELSESYGVSRERIRQIEVRAFEKLQSRMRELARGKGMAIPA